MRQPPASLRSFCLIAALAFVPGCGGPKRSDPQTTAATDTAGTSVPDTVAVPPAPPPAASIAYTRVVLHGEHGLRAFRDSIDARMWKVVLDVNRVDSTHVRAGDTLIVPSSNELLAVSPFPAAFDAVRDTSKLLLVSRRVQAFGVYERGRLIHWGPVSTGRKDMPTPTGLYHTNWKDRHRLSTVDSTWVLLWYLNLDNFQGVSLHQFELPGRPASHSCVRLLEEDAEWLYVWADQWQLGPDRRTILRDGTPVVVFGDWKYGGRAPWRRLPEDPDATRLTKEEMEDALRILQDRVKPKYPPRAKPGGA